GSWGYRGASYARRPDHSIKANKTYASSSLVRPIGRDHMGSHEQSRSAVTSTGDCHMSLRVSTGVARASTYRPLGRRSRRTTTSAIAAGTMAIALLAGAGNFANAAEYSSRTAQEQHACAVVMGLHEPGDLYNTCMRSLDKTLSELHQVRLA